MIVLTSSKSTSPASPPPLSSESLTFLRTSFHDKKVLSRETLALSCLIRKIRSAVEIDLTPLRLASAVDCTS